MDAKADISRSIAQLVAYRYKYLCRSELSRTSADWTCLLVLFIATQRGLA